MLVTSCWCVLHQPTIITFSNLNQFSPFKVKYCVLYKVFVTSIYLVVQEDTTLPIVVPMHDIELYGEAEE
jgi:hypothetical protein